VEVLGGAEGTINGSAEEAPGDGGGGPSAGLRRFRGRDPGGRVRRRSGDRVGHRPVSQPEREGRRGGTARKGARRRPRGDRAAGPETERWIRAHTHGRGWPGAVAAGQEAR